MGKAMLVLPGTEDMLEKIFSRVPRNLEVTCDSCGAKHKTNGGEPLDEYPMPHIFGFYQMAWLMRCTKCTNLMTFYARKILHRRTIRKLYLAKYA
jgi:ribosomal protein S27E